MPGYYRDVRSRLTDAGCRFVRSGKGDHEVWWSPKSERHFTVDKGMKSRHTANETLKQAGLPKAF